MQDVPFCPLTPSVTDLDGAKTRYAVTLRGLETGRAGGVISLYAGNGRYDVPFHNLVVRGTDPIASLAGEETVPSIPIVVRFANPVVLDGAAVTAIEENGMKPCNPVYAPWIAAHNREGSKRDRYAEKVRTQARAVAPIDAPRAVDDPVSCAVPYREPKTRFAFEPRNPYPEADGLAIVLVLLAPDDRILGTRVLKTAGNMIMDRVALGAAARSGFEGSVFRCHHVFGAYVFGVSFTPQNRRV